MQFYLGCHGGTKNQKCHKFTNFGKTMYCIFNIHKTSNSKPNQTCIPDGRIFKSLWNQKSTCRNPSGFNCVPRQKFDGLAHSLINRGILVGIGSNLLQNHVKMQKFEKNSMNTCISFKKRLHFTIPSQNPSVFLQI